MFHTPVFGENEFQRRYERAWERMEKAGIDALVCYNPGNQFWLTGYMGSLSAKRFPEFSHHALCPKVILPRGKQPILVGFVMPQETYEHETYIKDMRICGTPLEESRPKAIKDALTGLKLHRKNVAVDTGAYGGIVVNEFNNLTKALPHATFSDCTDLMYRLRMIKSEAEIGYLRIAVEIQNNAFRKFIRRIGIGMSETELMFTLTQCQAEAGATEMGIAMPWTHPGYTFFRAQFPDRLMEPGDFQWIDGGALYRGYCSDYDIIIAYGQPTSKQLKAFEDMQRIYREALQFWTPGRKIRDISKDVQRIVKAHNQVDPLNGHFTGHNLGYEMVEKPWFGVGAAADLKLEPNMVIAPEWFINTPFGPMLFEENFLVTEDGLERLTDYPSKLQVVAD